MQALCPPYQGQIGENFGFVPVTVAELHTEGRTFPQGIRRKRRDERGKVVEGGRWGMKLSWACRCVFVLHRLNSLFPVALSTLKHRDVAEIQRVLEWLVCLMATLAFPIRQ